MFEEFWRTFGDVFSVCLATNADKSVESYKPAIEAVWNDAQQILLAKIVFKLMDHRKQLVNTHVEGQVATAAVINFLGKLIVELSEMKI